MRRCILFGVLVEQVENRLEDNAVSTLVIVELLEELIDEKLIKVDLSHDVLDPCSHAVIAVDEFCQLTNDAHCIFQVGN